MTTIWVGDVGTTSRYELIGSVATMTDTGGCQDILNDREIRLSETMSDEEIEQLVDSAWRADYDGDPDDCGLRVNVEREDQ